VANDPGSTKMNNANGRIRFGQFEVDLSQGKLFKRGVIVRLENQPFQVLTTLVESPGTLVTREELQSRLWPTGTYVDFDEGLNTAVRKLRAALGDSPESPVFVETVPRRGYVLWARLITCRPPASYHLLYNMRAITAMEFHRSQRRQTRPPLRFRPKSAEIS
jgi:DNA-binding winged helix-turn-helix (wHTH) protein